MSGHASGPWWVTDYGVRDTGGYICATIKANHYWGQDERYAREIVEREANARLIAAAPTQHEEMLRFLPVIERAEADPDLWARLTDGLGIATANAYRAAIAKATSP